MGISLGLAYISYVKVGELESATKAILEDILGISIIYSIQIFDYLMNTVEKDEIMIPGSSYIVSIQDILIEKCCISIFDYRRDSWWYEELCAPVMVSIDILGTRKAVSSLIAASVALYLANKSSSYIEDDGGYWINKAQMTAPDFLDAICINGAIGCSFIDICEYWYSKLAGRR